MTINRNDYLLSRLGALCFFFSTIEYMIPKPLPFLRIGLANIPLMLAIDVLSPGGYLTLIAIKVLGQGLIGGTLFSYLFIFSAAGTLVSALTMFALRKACRSAVSFIGISVAGAFASNATQLLLARLYIFGESARFIAPPFFAVGLLTGGALGFMVNRFAGTSRWLAEARVGLVPGERMTGAQAFDAQSAVSESLANPAGAPHVTLRLVLGLALILTLMFAESLVSLAAPAELQTSLTIAAQALITAAGVILLLSAGAKLRILPIFSVTAGILAFNLMAPFGRVILEPFGLPVTDGALLLGIKKALTIEGMLFISRWMLHPPPRLPGRAGVLLSETFAFLGYLTASGKRLDRKNLVAGIDAIMYGPD